MGLMFGLPKLLSMAWTRRAGSMPMSESEPGLPRLRPSMLSGRDSLTTADDCDGAAGGGAGAVVAGSGEATDGAGSVVVAGSEMEHAARRATRHINGLVARRRRMALRRGSGNKRHSE